MTRPAHLCRSFLFIHGGEEEMLLAAAASGADVLIQELEDFTPPDLLPVGRRIAPDVYRVWRAAGAVAAVRINPLDGPGMEDLAAVMRGAPDIVALPKVSKPHHVTELAAAVARFERDYGIPEGATRLLPNVESAHGVLATAAIAEASPRIIGCLMASEDLATDLGAERAPDGLELAYARQRFLFECTAAGTLAIDCPYTWQDAGGVERDTRWARRLGYRAKSAVDHAHARIINAVLTPSEAEMAKARRIVAAFEAARVGGHARAELDGSLIEMPAYANARRLLARAAELSAVG